MGSRVPLPYTFKGNLEVYRKRLGIWRIVLALFLTFIFFIRYGIVFWVGSVVGITLIIVGVLWFVTRRTVTLTPEGLEYKGGLGKVRKVSYGEIEGAKVFVNYFEASFGSFPRISIGLKGSDGQKNADAINLVAGKKAGQPIVLTALFWAPEDMDKMIEVLNDKKLTVEYYEEPVPYGVIAKQFPTYTTTTERHPLRVGFGIAGIIFLAIIIIVIILVSLGLM